MKIYSIHYNNEPNEEKVRNHFTFETISWKCTSSEWVYMHVYICIRLVYFPSQFFSHSVYAYNMCCVGARVCVCQLPMNLQLEINFFVCINCVWNKKKLPNAKPKSATEVVSSAPCTHTHTHFHLFTEFVIRCEKPRCMFGCAGIIYVNCYCYGWVLHWIVMHFATVVFVPRPTLIKFLFFPLLSAHTFSTISHIFRFICTLSLFLGFTIWLSHTEKNTIF